MLNIKIEEIFKFLIVFLVILEKFLILVFKLDSNIAYVMYFLTLFFIFITIYQKKITKKFLGDYLAIFILVMIYTISSKTVDLLIVFLVILAFKDDSIIKMLKYFCLALSICVISTIILSKLGIISSMPISRLDANGNIWIRNSLGFSTANTAFIYFFAIIAILYITCPKIININIINIVGTLYLYHETNSRTGLIMSIILLICMLLVNKSQKTNNKLKVILKYSFLFFTIFSIFLAYTFGEEGNTVNQMFSDRMIFWRYALENVPKFSLFYNSIAENYIIDNTFLYIWLRYGIICYLIYNYFYMRASKNINNKKILIVLILFNIYGLMEANIVYDSNFTMFVLLYYYLKGSEKRDEKDITSRNVK